MKNNWHHLVFSVVFAWSLVGRVIGWGFSIETTTFAEGALGEFEITNDDGGGYTFPYTMTVFKQAPNSSDEQVGIVYANETHFEWWCNQPAGSTIWFRLMSAAAVNEATSRYYHVQPGAQATISSISTMSTASTARLSQTASSNQPISTTESLPSLNSSPKGVSTGVIAGATAAAVVFCLIVLAILVRVYRFRGFKPVYHAEPEAPLISIVDGLSQRPAAPPMGYVSQSSLNEAPPLYSLPTLISPSYQGSSTHWSPYGEVQRGVVAENSGPRPPARTGKSRHGPAGMNPS